MVLLAAEGRFSSAWPGEGLLRGAIQVVGKEFPPSQSHPNIADRQPKVRLGPLEGNRPLPPPVRLGPPCRSPLRVVGKALPSECPIAPHRSTLPLPATPRKLPVKMPRRAIRTDVLLVLGRGLPDRPAMLLFGQPLPSVLAIARRQALRKLTVGFRHKKEPLGSSPMESQSVQATTFDIFDSKTPPAQNPTEGFR